MSAAVVFLPLVQLSLLGKVHCVIAKEKGREDPSLLLSNLPRSVVLGSHGSRVKKFIPVPWKKKKELVVTILSTFELNPFSIPRLDVLRSGAQRQQRQQQQQQQQQGQQQQQPNNNNNNNPPLPDFNNFFAQMAAAGNFQFPAPQGGRGGGQQPPQQPQQGGQQQQQQQQQQANRPAFLPPPFPFFAPGAVPPPPMPPPNFAGMTAEELRAMEGDERENVEARIRCLRNIQVLLDAAVMEMQQYTSVVGALNRTGAAANAASASTAASSATASSATTTTTTTAASTRTTTTTASAPATATAASSDTGARPKVKQQQPSSAATASVPNGGGEQVRTFDLNRKTLNPLICLLLLLDISRLVCLFLY